METKPITASAYNPVKKKAYCGKVADLMAAIQAREGYPTGHWVTRKQAELLGGFAEGDSTYLQKNGGERRRTPNNSTALQSGVSKDIRGIRVRYFTESIDKKTGKSKRFPIVVEYFNVAQCWGVRIPMPELHPELAEAA